MTMGLVIHKLGCDRGYHVLTMGLVIHKLGCGKSCQKCSWFKSVSEVFHFTAAFKWWSGLV